MLQTEIQFVVPTLNSNGTPITEALTFEALIDTVTPPVKSYTVPAANVTAAVAGLVTAKFTDLGFTPVTNTAYYVEVIATDADGNSPPSNVVSFNYGVTPAAPTGVKVS